MEIVAAVAKAKENRPENATSEGISVHPDGSASVKFPTDVKKLAVNKRAGSHPDTRPKPVSATTQTNKEISCVTARSMTNEMNFVISKYMPLQDSGLTELLYASVTLIKAKIFKRTTAAMTQSPNRDSMRNCSNCPKKIFMGTPDS